MSWCRWSSLDFRCDLYVYESDRGVEVDVGSRRHKIDVEAVLGKPVPAGEEGWIEAYIHRSQAVMGMLATAEYEPIGLPHDGDFRTFDTLAEAADWIDELAALGYIVPEGMTADMRAAGRGESGDNHP